MKRLTIVSIVLMIPTLIVSFFGMNVDLPYQHASYTFLGSWGSACSPPPSGVAPAGPEEEKDSDPPLPFSHVS
jgi:hypothetical protein